MAVTELNTLASPIPALAEPKGPGQNHQIWIVLVNYNGYEDTRNCLRSLALLDHSTSVVVVDNASSENPTFKLKKEFPWADIIQSPENGGWAGGNNLGVQHALARGAEWIILLNNDTTVPPRFVRRLLEAAHNHPEFGILGPVILFQDDSESVQTTGVVFNRPDREGFFQSIDVRHDPEKPISVVPCDIVNGCCLMIRRDVIESIGLVDEAFFLIHEESDWCLRAQRMTQCGIVSDALVWHKGSSSFQREGKRLQRYYDTRNLVRLLRKHRGRSNTRSRYSSFRTLLSYARHRYQIERKSGHSDSAQAVVEGLYDGIKGRYGPYKVARRSGAFLIHFWFRLIGMLRP